MTAFRSGLGRIALMHGFSLRCLGIGDGWPSADRFHSAFLYRWGSARWLVDCGEPVSRALKGCGVDYGSLDRILLTHLHFDHVGGFFMLMQSCWLEARTRELCVHLPEEGIPPLRQMLHASYIFDDLLPFRLRWSPLQAGAPFEVEGVRVTPFPTTHLDRLRAAFGKRHAKPFAAFSFLFEWAGVRVAHSGDLGAVSDLEPLLTAPVDLLVCELAHFPVEEVLAFLRGRKLGKVVFVHLAGELWANRHGLKRRLAEGLGGIPVVLAQDGDEIGLTARTEGA